MIKDWINSFISFRARILIFVTIIVLTAIAAIYYINRHLEERIAGLVEEHINAISVSVDLAQSSFPSGEYIDELLRKDGRITVGFEVADTGPGIAPESLGQIFEPYFSTKETGIGLGLALTRKLIEDHGGQVTVNSELGVGTAFTVILPREPAASPQTASLPQAAPQFG